MQLWDLSATDRILAWKHQRTELASVSMTSAMLSAEMLWRSAPYAPCVLFDDDVDHWPDPWELITSNRICDLGIMLGIFYTLWLMNHNDISKLSMLYAEANNKAYHMVAVNDSYLIGFDDGVISPVSYLTNLEVHWNKTINDLHSRHKIALAR